MEIDDAQFEDGPVDPGFDNANLGPDELLDEQRPAYDPLLMPRMPEAEQQGDPTVKRPERRPPRPGTDPIDPTLERDSRVRCGDDGLVDLLWDPDHCGACHNACASRFCVSGICRPIRPAYP